MSVDTIIFDNEGVVVDTETIWDKGQEEFLRRRGFVYDRERVKHLLTGTTLADGVDALKREYGFSGDREALARERMEIVADVMKHEAKFIDGFSEFFERVRDRFKVCIATAMEGHLLKIVDHQLRLSQLFNDKVFSLADLGLPSKPNPDLFLYAARRLGSNPAGCVVIEDSPYGLEAAKRAGMRCIGITTTYQRARLSVADVVVDSYSEINLDSW